MKHVPAFMTRSDRAFRLLNHIYSNLSSFFPYNSFQKPIFIISPPRAGSTLLFESLTTFPGLYHLPNEGDNIWWRFFPYGRAGSEPSDYVPWTSDTSSSARPLRREIYERAVKHTLIKNKRGRRKFQYIFGLKKIRYLDKTIANCFHLDFLKNAFPDTQYIFLIRDPRSSIASMIEGWPHKRMFGKPQLTAFFPRSGTLTITHWSYPAPPGWQSVLHKPLPEICAWSWREHVLAALNFFDRTGAPVTRVYYEDLIKDTIAVMKRLSDALNLPFSDKTRAYLKNPPLSRTTVSPPNPRKWEIQNKEEITSIIPSIADLANVLGYDV